MADPEGPSRLHRVRRTVLQMLSDRGYLVPAEEAKLSLDDFKAKFSNAAGDVAYVCAPPGGMGVLPRARMWGLFAAR